MSLKLCRTAFDDPAWLFEVKHDGFRALAFIENGRCRLVSRNGQRFGEFRELEASVAQALRGRTAILDGEIVCLDAKGRSVFAELMALTASPFYYAFDVMWLDGQDWRQHPLFERKQLLLRLIERRKGRLLYVDHLPERGRSLYEVCCQWDLEGIVAKRKDSLYTTARAKTWLKIKNPSYSQAKGRHELFDGWRHGSNVTVK